MPAPVVDPTFLDRLEDTRRRLGLSWDALAAAIGVHPTALHRWRRGAARPSRAAVTRLAELATLAGAIARVYGVETAHLAAWLETPHALFGGESPRALLAGGRGHFLHAALAMHGRAVTPSVRSAPATPPAPVAARRSPDAALTPRSGA